MNTLDPALPRDPTLPFFAYGIFSPGQIAFFQIKNFVRQVTDASVTGVLRIRDGVPVLDATARSGTVDGYRIEFKDADSRLAYEAIANVEPKAQYRWDTDGGMNVLIGRSPRAGAHPMDTGPWSSWSDPAFCDALNVVDQALEQQSSWPDLEPFYCLQGAYMVLWSSIERYVSLRYGLGRNASVAARLKRLAREPGVADSLSKDSGVTEELRKRKVFRSDDPGGSATFDPSDPEKAISYLYQVRSNVTHRGKAHRLDWDLLRTATAETLRIFRDILHTAEEDARWTDTSLG